MSDSNREFYRNIPQQMPRTSGRVMEAIFRWLFSVMGWRFVGQPPAISKAVLILVPHTSNWDFFIAVCAKFALRLRASYIMKQEAFFWPFKNWLIGIGGIPIDRSQPTRIVGQVSNALTQQEGNWLVITPEGTRKKVDKYKTGFVRIAYSAKVPIIVAGFDYQQKAIIFAKVVEASGDYEADADELYRYSRETFVGRRPENQ